MKHIYNIIKVIPMLIFRIIAMIIGWVLVPLFMTRQEKFECKHKDSRPNRRFKNKWFDSIFGNRDDGNDGDVYYKRKCAKLTWWTTYNWVAFRNPIHNLALKMGVDEVIKDYKWVGNRYTEDRIDREGFVCIQ